jgi:hypothetical protein
LFDFYLLINFTIAKDLVHFNARGGHTCRLKLLQPCLGMSRRAEGKKVRSTPNMRSN